MPALIGTMLDKGTRLTGAEPACGSDWVLELLELQPNWNKSARQKSAIPRRRAIIGPSRNGQAGQPIKRDLSLSSTGIGRYLAPFLSNGKLASASAASTSLGMGLVEPGGEEHTFDG
ncbi:MAG TPA: hypothetical protein VL361_08610 [Candidatus Limnocylindrales bacterium]|jgi:hypothetical protein|nr:hypothetical protein [Candidatus Limnocylindrales bacterium]